LAKTGKFTTQTSKTRKVHKMDGSTYHTDVVSVLNCGGYPAELVSNSIKLMLFGTELVFHASRTKACTRV
jgi:predicted metal-binding protein